MKRLFFLCLIVFGLTSSLHAYMECFSSYSDGSAITNLPLPGWTQQTIGITGTVEADSNFGCGGQAAMITASNWGFFSSPQSFSGYQDVTFSVDTTARVEVGWNDTTWDSNGIPSVGYWFQLYVGYWFLYRNEVLLQSGTYSGSLSGNNTLEIRDDAGGNISVWWNGLALLTSYNDPTYNSGYLSIGTISGTAYYQINSVGSGPTPTFTSTPTNTLTYTPGGPTNTPTPTFTNTFTPGGITVIQVETPVVVSSIQSPVNVTCSNCSGGYVTISASVPLTITGSVIVSNLTPQFTQLPYATALPWFTAQNTPTQVPTATAITTAIPVAVTNWPTAVATWTAQPFPYPTTQQVVVTNMPTIQNVAISTFSAPWPTALPTATPISNPLPVTIPAGVNVVATNGGWQYTTYTSASVPTTPVYFSEYAPRYIYGPQTNTAQGAYIVVLDHTISQDSLTLTLGVTCATGTFSTGYVYLTMAAHTKTEITYDDSNTNPAYFVMSNSSVPPANASSIEKKLNPGDDRWYEDTPSTYLFMWCPNGPAIVPPVITHQYGSPINGLVY